MASKLSGQARKIVVRSIVTGLATLQEDGEISAGARMGLLLFTGWLTKELARLEAKYPDTVA